MLGQHFEGILSDVESVQKGIFKIHHVHQVHQEPPDLIGTPWGSTNVASVAGGVSADTSPTSPSTTLRKCLDAISDAYLNKQLVITLGG